MSNFEMVYIALWGVALGSLAIILTAIWQDLEDKAKRRKRTKAYQKAQKIKRRATATEYAKELQKAYLTTLYGGK